jgi:hypothetical protein
MKILVTILPIVFGFVAYTRRSKKISRQIWYLERQTMTRFESFFRSLVYGVVIYVLSSTILPLILNALGIEV